MYLLKFDKSQCFLQRVCSSSLNLGRRLFLVWKLSVPAEVHNKMIWLIFYCMKISHSLSGNLIPNVPPWKDFELSSFLRRTDSMMYTELNPKTWILESHQLLTLTLGKMPHLSKLFLIIEERVGLEYRLLLMRFPNLTTILNQRHYQRCNIYIIYAMSL